MANARVFFGWLWLLVACGPTALRPAVEGPTIAIGDQNRRIETLTDLEEVRAVAEVGENDYIATDMGLWRFATTGPQPEAERVEGLASRDVIGLAEDEGGLVIATAGGLAELRGETVTPMTGVPNVGPITDLARTTDGTIWLCGLAGLARRRTGATWEVVGDPVRCTTLAPTPEGQLWVGTTAGMLYVEGDVAREHPISGGMPEGYVRSIVPVLPGQILAILQGPAASEIGFWDGERWYGYTVRGLEGPLVGLVRRGNDVILASQDRLLLVSPQGMGVPFVPVSNSPGTVRSFRPTITAAADQRPLTDVPDRDVLKEPTHAADVPDRPAPSAPPFVARPLDVELPGRVYRAFVVGDEALLAISNGGVLELRASESRRLQTRTLVPEENLQIATDSRGSTWVLSRDRELTKWMGGRLRRAPVPEGIATQAIATGPHGAIMIALEPSAGPGAVRLFVNAGSGWRSLAQRTLQTATPLLGVPFIGVAPDGKVWAALRVAREDDPATGRMRGVAVIDPDTETIAYHWRGATQGQGLQLPDEVESIEFDTDGNAWFSSISGLVRVGNQQAVVFGESRGVRGEVVSDLAVGNSILWVASAEGLGSYDRSRFDYAQPANIESARPTRLAMDLQGTLWGVSRAGLVMHRGSDWAILDHRAGLPQVELVDVETDREGRVWLLATDRLLVLEH